MVTISPMPGAAPNEEGEQLFAAHGIEIVKRQGHWDFIFPPGTTRAEILPQMQWTERSQLVCPDGFTVQESISLLSGSQSALSYHLVPPTYEIWAGSRVLHSGKDLQEALRLYQQAGFDHAYRKKQISLLKNGTPIGIMHPALV
jgi:hypothetical protein